MCMTEMRREWEIDEALDVQPDREFDGVGDFEDAPDAVAAVHGAGGDADRAEQFVELNRDARRDAPLPDDERPL